MGAESARPGGGSGAARTFGPGGPGSSPPRQHPIRHAAADAFYDWQGGLLWIRIAHEAEAAALRGLMPKFGGGHATLVRAPQAVRAEVPVFEPQPPALAALSKRLKQEFDPKDILNPRRIGAEL